MTYLSINTAETLTADLETTGMERTLARCIARSYASLVESEATDFADLIRRLDDTRRKINAEYGSK